MNIKKHIECYYKRLLRLKCHFLIYPESRNGFKSIDRKTMLSFNKVRHYGPKQLVCYNPFVSLRLNSRGQAVACCRNNKYILGNYLETSIKEIWFGKKAEKLREHLLNNDLSLGCDFCNYQLKTHRFSGLPSMLADRYSSTKLNYPKILELAFSNTCNLECIMCSGLNSSSIRKNREKKVETEEPYDENFANQLEEFLPHVKEICFSGGEPFLIKPYYQIWDSLLNQKSKAKLHVVTNGTIFNKRIEYILNNLPFTISVSFDAIDKQLFESIRLGADYDTVIQNIFNFNRILRGEGLTLSMTTLINNRFEVPKVIDFCNSINAIIYLSFVENPFHLALWSLKSSELAELENYYLTYIFKKCNKYNSRYNKQVYIQFIHQIKQYKIRNRKLEKEFETTYSSISNSIQRQKKWNDNVLYHGLMSETDFIKINRCISDLLDKKSEIEKKSFHKQYADLLESIDIEYLKTLKSKHFDFNDIENKLKELAAYPSIYSNSSI